MLNANQIKTHVIYLFKLKFTSEPKTLNYRFINKKSCLKKQDLVSFN